ncbi:hypothetical protein ES705_07713 [subsurface metagenome]
MSILLFISYYFNLISITPLDAREPYIEAEASFKTLIDATSFGLIFSILYVGDPSTMNRGSLLELTDDPMRTLILVPETTNQEYRNFQFHSNSFFQSISFYCYLIQ